MNRAWGIFTDIVAALFMLLLFACFFVACEDIVFYNTSAAETGQVVGKEYAPEHGHGKHHHSEKYMVFVRAKDGKVYKINTKVGRYVLYQEGDSVRIRKKWGKVTNINYGAVF